MEVSILDAQLSINKFAEEQSELSLDKRILNSQLLSIN